MSFVPLTSHAFYQVALAWQVYEQDGRLVARHPGSLRGYKSLLISYPQQRNGIVPRLKIANKLMQALRDSAIWQQHSAVNQV